MNLHYRDGDKGGRLRKHSDADEKVYLKARGGKKDPADVHASKKGGPGIELGMRQKGSGPKIELGRGPKVKSNIKIEVGGR